MLGTTSAPVLDLVFSATSNDALTHTVYLYLSQTGLTGPGGAFAFTLGGTQPPAGSTNQILARAFGGNSNNNLDLSSPFANLSANTSPFVPSANGVFAPTVGPYALTIGLAITRTVAGTSMGDLNLAIRPNVIPEPESLLLLATGLAGWMGVSRRRKSARLRVD